MTRDIDATATFLVDPTELWEKDNLEQLFDAVSKSAERKFNNDEKSSVYDVDVEIEFTRYSTGDHKELTLEQAKELTERADDIEADEAYAEITVKVTATEEGEYNEGYISNDWYEPDEPSYVEGYETDEVEKLLFDSIEEAFSEMDLSVIEYEAGESNTQSWEQEIEAYENYEPDYDPYDD